MSDKFPITGPQYNFWVDQMINPDSPIYNIGGYVDIKGPIDHTDLRKVVNSFLKKNDAVRLQFSIDEEGKPYQYFVPYSEMDLPLIDYSDREFPLESAQHWIKEQYKIPYNMNDTSLYTIKLLKLSDSHYIYYLKFHHIIVDGWGTLTMIKKIIDEYNALMNNEEPDVTEYSYVDFINDDLKYQNSKRYLKSEKYWEEKFKTVPDTMLSTPLFRMPETSHSDNNRRSIAITPENYAELNRIAEEAGVTTFSVILGIMYIQLNKITNLDEIIIGIPLLNRNNRAFKETVGLFVETSPLIICMDNSITLAEFLHQIKKELAECYRHQRFPAGKIAELAQTNTFSRLLDVSLSYEKHTESKGILDYETHSIAVSSGCQNNALSLYIREYHAGEDVIIDFDSRPDIFRDYSIEKMTEQFEVLYKDIIANPNSKLADLNIIPEEERKLLESFNNTSGSYEAESNMVELFERQVEMTPDLPAITTEETTLSYRELNESANKIANAISQDFNIVQDDRIALVMNRSEKVVITILGILKSGAAYVPVDPDYPDERISYMFEDAAPKAVITEDALLGKVVFPSNIPVVEVEKVLAKEHSVENLNLSISKNALAYIIYTSGSTGKPKGVMIEHRSTTNVSQAWKEMYKLDEPGFSLLQIASFSFDVATGDIIRALHHGGNMVIVEKEKLLDPELFSGIIEQYNISIFEGTPKMLIPTFEYLKKQGKSLPSLKTVILGSDICTREDFVKVKSYLTDEQQLVNSYGVTEATIDSTWYPFTAEANLVTPVVSIGAPMLNTETYILDAFLNIVPHGASGELCLSGKGLARGYLNRPDLTSEKFIDNPFTPGEKLYRTGDLARWLPDGNIDFIGRIDNQVKIRGFRVELGEIENALSRYEQFESSVVAAKTTTDGDLVLVGYYISEYEPDITSVKTYLAQSLPDYMIPSLYVKIDEVPLTHNGKINTKALPEPDFDAVVLSVEYVAPSTETEVFLAKTWAETLNVDRVGIKDNFFDLGGHSLKAIKVISRVNKELEAACSLKDIFEYPTVELFAKALSGKSGEKQSTIVPVNQQNHYPVSNAQRRLWLIDQMDKGSTTYNMPGAFILEGEFNEEAFQSSFGHLIARHEILRTQFINENGEPRQKILLNPDYRVHIEDLREHCSAMGIVEAKAEEEMSYSFDLEKGPLVRFSVFRIEDEKYMLLFNMHHIISDGWSLQVFFEEFLTRYNMFRDGKTPDSAPLNIHYKDFTIWQNSFFESDEITRQGEYWKERFADEIPVLNMPGDKIRPSKQSYNGKQTKFSIGGSLYEKLRLLCKNKNLSMFMLLNAAVKTLLHRYTGQNDIVVGSPIAGRNHEELNNQIGFYVNTLAMRDTISPEMTFADFLEQVKNNCRDAFANQDYPFDKLVEELNIKRDISRSPLFDVMMVLQNSDEELPDFGGLKLTPFNSEIQISKFDISFDITDTSSELKWIIEFNTDIYFESRIERMVKHLMVLLESATANPETAVGALDIISEDEKELLINGFNQTKVPYPNTKSTADLFEEIVEEYSDNIAVEYYNSSITYREMNNWANDIAHYLIDTCNVQTEELVGIHMDRSIEMMVTIMAVQKAGGAYVPIDPSFPEARLEYIIEDAAPKVILTDKSDFERGIHITSIQKSMKRHENPLRSANGDTLAYVIYTSGSTGNPKGTLIEHKVVNRLVRNANYSEYLPDDKILHVSNFTFDASIFDIFGAFLNGSTLVEIDKSDLVDMQVLSSVIRVKEVTGFAITTTLLNNLIDYDVHCLDNMKNIYFGGEQCSPQHIKRLFETLGENRLTHVYGPTEVGVVATSYPINRLAYDHEVTYPIGGPISNTTAYVMDNNLQLVPIGVPGELCMGDDGLARGYLNRPELTAEKFVQNPYLKGELMYRSGDLVKWLSDGSIEFIGRIDNQVKIRGFRIEPGEIENALAEHEAVQQAVVLVKTGDDGSKYLAAYFVADRQIPIAEVRGFLAENLPEYMIPSCFIAMDEFPLNQSNKVDRKALPEPDESLFSTGSEYVAPRTKNEVILADIWKEVLSRSKNPSIDDNFFELGGDSIKAIQIVARLSQHGLKGEISALFNLPTIRELAPKLTENRAVIDQGTVTGEVPLTPIQKWFFHELKGPKHHFNQAVMVSLKEEIGESQINSLKGAMEALLEHHDHLRTQFLTEESTVVQRVRESAKLSFVTHDLREKDDIAAAITDIANETQSSFDLADDTLIRFVGFHCQDSFRLLIVAHHLVIDGISWRGLLEDIETGFRQIESGKSVKLPPKTVSVKEWSETVTEMVNSESFEKEKEYWINIISKEKMSLPAAEKSGKRVDASIELTAEETEALLMESCKAFNTGVNDLLITALARALSLWSGSKTVTLDMESHGRSEHLGKDISRTIGWCTSVYPVVVELPENGSSADQIIEVKEMLNGVPNYGMGYGMLKYLSDIELESTASSIAFNYLGQFDSDMETELFSPAEESVGNSVSCNIPGCYALNFNGMVQQGTFKMVLDSDQYSQECVETVAALFKDELRSLIDYCVSSEETISTPADFTIPAISLSEYRSLLHETGLNATQIQDVYTLTSLQEGLLFHAMMDERSSMYFEQLTLDIRGEMNKQAFSDAWNEIGKRHDVFRTLFIKELREPVQVVMKERPVPCIFRDIRVENSSVEAIMAEDRANLFDLSKDPLFRVTAVQKDDESFSLIVSFHHIILDGWCTAIFFSEFLKIYESMANNSPVKIEKAPQFSHYISWLNKQESRKSRQFWKEYLAGYDELVSVPEDFENDNAAVMTEEKLIIDEVKTTALKKLASELGVTLNTVVQTVWGILLSRYNGTNDVVFGSTVSGRPQEIDRVDEMIGLFINTIPVRIELEEGVTFRTAASKIQKEALSAIPHHHCSLADIQSDTGLSNGLLDHIMVFENYPIDEALANGDTPFDIVGSNTFEQTNFDFGIVVYPSDTLSITLDYNASKYCKARIKNMVSHLETAFDEVVDNKDILLSDLNIIGETERNKLLYELNQSGMDYPRDKTLADLFEDMAANNPDAPSLILDGAEMNYGELNEQANCVANYLIRNYDITADSLVAFAIPRSMEMIIALLGILKAGAAYVPIDPDYPDERIEYILDDASPEVLITSDGGRNSLSLESIFSSGESTENPVRTTSGENLAYVIYTSGSTGKPKGVLIEHSSVLNLIYSHKKYLNLGENERMLQFSSICFDASVEQVWMPLSSAGAIVLIDKETILSGEEFNKYIVDNRVTYLDVNPSYLESVDLTESPWLRRVVVGSEKLPVHIAKKYCEKLELYNFYGPTETTVSSLRYRVSPEDSLGSRVPIGKQVENTRIYVVDKNGSMVPQGSSGEICIAGECLARGYLNRDEITAEKFVDDPFHPGEKMYITGDLGRWMFDDNIEFLGRIDDQIKIRGFRIEPGEIEKAVQEIDGVRSAFVFGETKNSGENYLSAYYTTEQNRIAAKNGEVLVHTIDQRPDLRHGVNALHNESWPAYFEGNDATQNYWDRIYREYPELQLVLTDEQDCIVAAANAVPIYWDGKPETLHDGWDSAVESAFISEMTPNTLCVLAAVVDSGSQGEGLSYAALNAMKQLAVSEGFEEILIPVRPTMKKISQTMDLLDYCSQRDENGKASDPWLRVHENCGGTVIGYCEKSQLITGSIIQWQHWSGETFTDSGSYELDDTMQPLYIDLADDCGTYYDQAVWIQHDVAESSLNTISTRVIKNILGESLPAYMIPKYFTKVETIPLTSNGKIDRKALPNPLVEAFENRECKVPSNETEAELLSIWKTVLGIDTISVDDDFFDLGGHSLKAMQLVSMIYKKFDQTFPLKQLFVKSTIEQVAAVLTGDAPAEENYLVPLREHGTETPLFLVPGAVGDVHYYKPLTEALGSVQPVFGLAGIGADGSRKPLNSIEEMAEIYVCEIMKVQKSGPFKLGGHSFGGAVAYEIARQLSENGHEISHLVIMDALAPDISSNLKFDEKDGITWLMSTLAEMQGIAIEFDAQEILSLSEANRWSYLEQLFADQGIDYSPQLLRGVWDLYKTNCLIQYHPHGDISSDKLSLLKSQETVEGEQAGSDYDADFGWSRYVNGSIEMHAVPGSHESMLQDPHVQVIADILRKG